jgi:prepilin-type N-terminal cleavage/methylation domain-containing protein/prepilin-type processing-associated H-X9-DG protein
MKSSNRSNNAFTLIELLVVIAIIALLLGILMPSLQKAKQLVAEKVCSSSLRQVSLALMVYAQSNNGWLPLEPTEHNSHPGLLDKLNARNDGALMKAFYCSRDEWQEKIAQNTSEYIPNAATDSVTDTPENRQLGNIGYVYWSFEENKYFGEKPWRNPAFFIPRKLRTGGVKWIYPGKPSHNTSSSEIWVISDFFRRGAPFPHTRKHAHGLNMSYLDGHVDLLKGKPKLSYR